MSKILYNNMYEREGNDSWLKDYIEIVQNPMGLFLNHSFEHNGWVGELEGSHTIKLDRNNIEESQKRIDQYIDNNSLFHVYPSGKEEGIKIDLNAIL